MRQDLETSASASWLWDIDPRAKLISIFFLTGVIAMVREVNTLLFSLMITMGLILLSGISILPLLKRFSLSFPFIIFATFSLYWTGGIYPAEAIFLRITTAVFLLLLLSSTTPFFSLLQGLRALRMPEIYLQMLLFVHHYIYVFRREMERMEEAKRARGFIVKESILNRHVATIFASSAGALLVRAYERGKMFYNALQSRGFQGELKGGVPLTLQVKDAVFTTLIILISFWLLFIEWYGVV